MFVPVFEHHKNLRQSKLNGRGAGSVVRLVTTRRRFLLVRSTSTYSHPAFTCLICTSGTGHGTEVRLDSVQRSRHDCSESGSCSFSKNLSLLRTMWSSVSNCVSSSSGHGTGIWMNSAMRSRHAFGHGLNESGSCRSNKTLQCSLTMFRYSRCVFV